MKGWFIDKNGVKKKIIEVWEAINGDLYFVAERVGDNIFCYARLYSMPDMAEWGWSRISYLKRAYGDYRFWRVEKKHWANIDSYEEGLLEYGDL